MNLLKGQPKSKDGIDLYSKKDFEGMHAAGRIAAEILDEIVTSVFPGQTTGKIDSLIEQMIKDKGVESATVGYRGYQHASCISVNHVVCHGIPSDKILKEGDILNIDGTVIKDGWFGDICGNHPFNVKEYPYINYSGNFHGLTGKDYSLYSGQGITQTINYYTLSLIHI